MHNCLNEVFSATEAALKWGLQESTVRKALQNKRFTEDEYRKSGRITLVTKQGMIRLFGKLENE